MVQIHQHCERLAHDLIGFPAFDVDHEANAAGLVLVAGIVQTLFGGITRVFHKAAFLDINKNDPPLQRIKRPKANCII